MTNTGRLSTMTLAACILGACASGGASSLPGETKADRILAADTGNTVLMLDGAINAECSTRRIVDTVFVAGAPDTGWKEIWSVESCGQIQQYDIVFTPSPRGGTTFSVSAAG